MTEVKERARSSRPPPPIWKMGKAARAVPGKKGFRGANAPLSPRRKSKGTHAASSEYVTGEELDEIVGGAEFDDRARIKSIAQRRRARAEEEEEEGDDGEFVDKDSETTEEEEEEGIVALGGAKKQQQKIVAVSKAAMKAAKMAAKKAAKEAKSAEIEAAKAAKKQNKRWSPAIHLGG